MSQTKTYSAGITSLQECARHNCPYLATRGHRHCYFHHKVKTGLIVTKEPEPRIPGQHYDLEESRYGVATSDVASDEQRELADTLELLEVPPHLVKDAFCRSLSV